MMKQTAWAADIFFFLHFLTMLLVLMVGPAQAASLTWDITSGDIGTVTDGSGNWNNGAGNWNSGSSDTTWNNSTPDSAFIGAGGTAGTITLAGGITIGNITFNAVTGSYTIQNNTLTLSGGTPTITANVNASISSSLAGTGFIKSGVGTLTLSGNNTYTGATAIIKGSLIISGTNGSIAGSSGVTLRNNGALSLSNTPAANNANRIANGLTSCGGCFNFLNDGSNGAFSEELGMLALNSGQLTFTNSQAGASGTSILTFASFARSIGGSMRFVGTGFGAVGDRNSIKFVTAPANINSILPYALVVDSNAPGGWTNNFAVANGNGNALTSYTGYQTGAETTWTANTVNARPASSQNMNGSYNRTLNSLTLDNGINLTIGSLNNCTISLGASSLAAIVQTGGSSVIQRNGNGATVFSMAAGTELIINTIGDLTIERGNGYVFAWAAGMNNLTKCGPGTLYLGNTDGIGGFATTEFSGNFTINEGSVRLTGNNTTAWNEALGVGPIVMNGGKLSIAESAAQTYSPNVAINADATIESDRYNSAANGYVYTFGTLTVTNSPVITVAQGGKVTGGNMSGYMFGNTTLNSPVTFNITKLTSGMILTLGSVTDNGYSITLKGNGNFAQSAVWASGTAGGLTLDSTYSGTASLDRANTFTGGVALNGGTLNINNAKALGATASVFTINGGTIDNAGGVAISNSQNNAINIGADFAFTGTQNLNLGAGAVALKASCQITVNANTLTLGGVISGNGNGLTKAGNGILVLSANNTYSGLTTVSAGTLTLGGANTGGGSVALNAGTLNINNAAALGTGIFSINGGKIDSSAADVSITTDNPQEWNGDFTFIGTKNFNLGNGAVSLGASIQVKISNKTFTVGGVLSGNGFSLTKAGSGTLILSGTNTYTGGTTIIAGDVRIQNSSALGAGAITNLVYGDSYGLNLNADRMLVNNMMYMSNGYLKATGNTSGSDYRGGIILADGTTNGFAAASSFTVSGNIVGGGALLKTNAFSLTLCGTNTYTGATIVNTGILKLSSSNCLAVSTNITVSAGATLCLATNCCISPNSVLCLNGYYGKMILSNTVVQTVYALNNNGTAAYVGTWGATGSGSQYTNNNCFSGSGLLRISSGPVLGDLDGDGVSDSIEDICGTDPTNMLSVMKITRINPTNAADLTLHFNIGSNRTVTILASDSPTGIKTNIGSVTNSGFPWTPTNWTDSSAINSNTARRFYTLMVTNYTGGGYTNTEEWAMYVQPRQSNRWVMAGMPVDFESSHENTLTNTLGAQLIRGMKQGVETNGDLLYLLEDIGSSTNFVKHWSPTGTLWHSSASTNANTMIYPWTGFWVQRKASPDTNAVYTGRARTNLVYEVPITNGWNFLAWPCRTDRKESDIGQGAASGTNNIGWGFLQSGGKPSTIATNADTILLVQGNSWKRYYLLTNGRWWDYLKGGYADFTMQTGQGFYYYRRGTTGFVWTNSYGP